MDTPVPIPNTAVKHPSADDTWLETTWESRNLPDLYQDLMLIAWGLVLRYNILLTFNNMCFHDSNHVNTNGTIRLAENMVSTVKKYIYIKTCYFMVYFFAF